jgi:cell division protein FtsW
MPYTREDRPWTASVTLPENEGLVPALLTAQREPSAVWRGASRLVLAPLSLSLDQVLALLVAALLAVGLIMVQSAEAQVREVRVEWFQGAFNTKNALHAGIGLLVMIVLWRWDYARWLGKKLWTSPAFWFLLVTFGLLISVLLVGTTVKGARRWLTVPVLKFNFQPSELVKLAMILFTTAYAVHAGPRIRNFFTGVLPVLAGVGVVLLLVVKEDFGTTALIGVVFFCLLLMAGVRWWHMALILPPALAVGVYFIVREPYRRQRLTAFWDIFWGQNADLQGAGYHPWQSLLTIINGGIRGQGLGHGVQKMGFLPEDNTDFIFAVICEELGVIGAGLICALFIAIVLVGWRIMMRCQTLPGKMVAFGITAMIGLQAAINIAVVTVSVPTKGIALPLISSGGTGWIMTAAAVGVLMAVERMNRKREREHAHTPRARYSPGTDLFAMPVLSDEVFNLEPPAGDAAPVADYAPAEKKTPLSIGRWTWWR